MRTRVLPPSVVESGFGLTGYAIEIGGPAEAGES